jgi:DNA-binding GntR family transcriptional regulator
MLDVFEAMQRDILHCDLRPGSRLRLKDLRQRYRCGLSPLREALMRLVADGLVVLEDRKGFCVAPVSKEEVVDLTNIRCELEAFAIRKAIEKGDDHWEANLLARAHELSKRPMTAGEGVIDTEWENRHKAFHQALYASCGSPWLIHLCGLLFDRAARYRRLSVENNRTSRDVVKEHNNLLRAAIDRDAAIAEQLIREHLSRTTELILAGTQDKPAAKSGRTSR